MFEWMVTPGSMGVVETCAKLLGCDKVNPGSWGTPVYIRATEEEARVCLELLNELGTEVNTTFKITCMWSVS